MAEAFVYDAIRTPRGQGQEDRLASTRSSRSTSSSACSTRSKTATPRLDPDRVDDVVLGVVSPIGDQGGDIAKTAALAAGLPRHRRRACS